jgi:NAD(P)H-dependent flavin oxidoreductase YrpB (nitropropane dioxygenase family)
MLTTIFTELVGCSIPVQQAGMSSVRMPPLAAAVAEAGGLGMVGAARVSLLRLARCSTTFASVRPVQSG